MNCQLVKQHFIPKCYLLFSPKYCKWLIGRINISRHMSSHLYGDNEQNHKDVSYMLANTKIEISKSSFEESLSLGE
jgi:hypothetical protein